MCGIGAILRADGKPIPASWVDAIDARIAYRGPESGDLLLRCPTGFCGQLAANRLGLDPSDPDTQAASNDAVKEFMNVVCGHFVTAMYGKQPVRHSCVRSRR